MSDRICYYVIEAEYVAERGYRALVVTENEPGYQRTGTWPNDGTGVMPYFWGHDFAKAEEVCRRQNAALGLTERDILRIVASSMGAQAEGD